MSSLEPASHRLIRLIVVPTCLFLALAGGAFALAKLHLAKPGTPKTAGAVKLGDAYRGENVFTLHCAGCHGDGGKGGSAPKLVGSELRLSAVKARIDGGGSVMPANLVNGRDEEDVLAYLATILRSP